LNFYTREYKFQAPECVACGYGTLEMSCPGNTSMSLIQFMVTYVVCKKKLKLVVTADNIG